MADNGVQFALSLHQMHEDLHDLAANMERGRKQWKQNGLSAEKRVQDSEALMEKAKSKYDSLAEDYDRARTGDKQAGRVFGLKGPKSAAQHEEDLHRKVQQADSDYSSRVQNAKSQREELVSTLRPQAIKALQDLINECDSGLTLQLQKFASFNEKLLLGNGLLVSPLNKDQNSGKRSLRDVVAQIDNGRDLNGYVSSFASKIGNSGDIKYERHPTLNATQQTPPPINNRNQPMPAGSASAFAGPSPAAQAPNIPSQNFNNSAGPQAVSAPAPPSLNGLNGSPHNQIFPSMGASGPPLPPAQNSTQLYSQPPMPIGMSNVQNNNSTTSLPALRPVFGLSLEDLLKRDGSAIPLVVYQCIQAVDLYGLEVEGIYRLSGSSNHVSKLRSIFDNDFRNPEAFYHDVNSVAGLLKQFFRDLPDPLLTQEHYQGFIEAAHTDPFSISTEYKNIQVRTG
ncbi:Rho GTPase-activating protein RGD1, partial [Lecanoromycetidae sp. Uapishka_2]